MALTTIELEALAIAEWQHFVASKTVKAVGALVVASTGAYVQGLLVPSATPPLTCKEWGASLAAAVVALVVRHTLAGIEAKQDALLSEPATPPAPEPGRN